MKRKAPETPVYCDHCFRQARYRFRFDAAGKPVLDRETPAAREVRLCVLCYERIRIPTLLDEMREQRIKSGAVVDDPETRERLIKLARKASR